MKVKRRHTVYIAVFGVLLLLLYLLLVFSAAIPNSAIIKNMLDSSEYIANEKPYVFSEDGKHVLF